MATAVVLNADLVTALLRAVHGPDALAKSPQVYGFVPLIHAAANQDFDVVAATFSAVNISDALVRIPANAGMDPLITGTYASLAKVINTIPHNHWKPGTCEGKSHRSQVVINPDLN